MKARILHTRFWKDKFVSELTPVEKLLFVYILTNDKIGLSGVYELTDREIIFDTGVNQKQLDTFKEKVAGRINFAEGWVKVVNSSKYQTFRGEKSEVAKKKELKLVAPGIKGKLDTPSIPHRYPIDGSSNKYIVINNKKGGSVRGEKYTSDFEAFWKVYPRKIAKKKAFDVWEDIDPGVELAREIAEAAEAYSLSKQTDPDGQKYIAHPTTWLNQQRWEDELPGYDQIKRKKDKEAIQREIDEAFGFNKGKE